MIQPIHEQHVSDALGNPAGGTTTAIGLEIQWQNGPLGRGEERREPNGCFVETVIQAAIGRLEYYQRSRFACAANARALESLRAAIEQLQRRTAERESRQVEGTHEP